MIKFKFFCTLAVAIFGALSCGAVIAKPGVIEVNQPDGEVIKVRLHGDENMHFMTTVNGSLIMQNNAGEYVYADLDGEGKLNPLSIKVTNEGNEIREADAGKVINIKDVDFKKIEFLRGQTKKTAFVSGERPLKVKKLSNMIPQSGLGLSSFSYPHFGNPKVLVILVQYSDVSFHNADAWKHFNDMLNKENYESYGATGSAHDYFKAQSGGQFVPEFDVYGPLTLPNTQAYYGANDRYGNDARAHLMVTDAIDMLKGTVNFSEYDTDKDGVIDNVYVFYAGRGEATGGGDKTVWPHAWDIRSAGVYMTVNGVSVGPYACSNEMSSATMSDGIGTFIHEFSHVLGLPDLYATDYNHSETPGNWSVLDTGSYNNNSRTPPNYGAYEKNALGWYMPILLDEPLTVTLENINTGHFGLIPTERDNEFFLLENRQKKGWDKYLPNHGLMIWHIDYDENVFVSNQVNNTRSHQYVEIEKANNRLSNSMESYTRGWAWPGTTDATSFTEFTVPAMVSWAGNGVNLPVTDILEEDELISFNVAGGHNILDAPEPSAHLPETGSDYFVASWPGVDFANDYLLTVVACDTSEPATEEIHFDDSQISDGWQSNMDNVNVYIGVTNVGESAPSLKFSETGEWLLSPEFPNSVAKIEFWVKGERTSDSDTHIAVEGLVNGEWKEIVYYVPQNLRAENVTLENEIPADVRQVRFTMVKDEGNIALDDIVVTYGGRHDILPDYNEASTEGATSVKVDKLKDGIELYYFNVVATDGLQRSHKSEAVYVNIPVSTSVTDIAVDNDKKADEGVMYFNLQGREIKNPSKGALVIKKEGGIVTKIIY